MLFYICRWKNNLNKEWDNKPLSQKDKPKLDDDRQNQASFSSIVTVLSMYFTNFLKFSAMSMSAKLVAIATPYFLVNGNVEKSNKPSDGQTLIRLQFLLPQ
jgi:hypothetical protein